jgi:membrane protein YdbS with pleckstrin-like domain
MEFLIHHNGREIGPYSEAEVRGRLTSGAIHPSDLAWHEGAPDWAPLSSFPQFAGASRPTPPPLPPGALTQPSPVPSSPSSTLNPPSSAIPSSPSSTLNPPSSASLSSPPPPLAQTPQTAPSFLLPTLDRKSVGPYTAATLQADERPLHKTTIHWMVLLIPCLAALFALILIGPIAMVASWKGATWVWLLMAIPVVIIASAVLTVKKSELVITDRRVLIKVGFIRRQTFEMFISKIESVAVAQGMMGRFFNYGTVEIRGTGGSAESFATIVAPLQFGDAIQLVQSQSERR